VNQDQIWTAVQDELRFQLAKPSYETWLKNTTLLSADGSIYRVGVPSKLAKDWLEDRFAGLIQETLQAVTGNEVEVDFVVSNNGHRSALAGEDDLLAADDMPEPPPPVGQSELSEKF
jgi:chromosomal replication initiator protein